jgi:hypothetical protein
MTTARVPGRGGAELVGYGFVDATTGGAVGEISLNPVVLAVLIAVIVVVAWTVARFAVFCLTDLARTEDWQLRYFTRKGWVIFILLSIPLGGILYLVYGKAR